MTYKVSSSNRHINIGEREYWEAIDRGERICPPVPCRECGFVWEHDSRCVNELNK